MTEAASFHAAYGAELPWVWLALRRLGVPANDLPDASHDVFVVAWERRSTFVPGRPVRPWLFGIACRLAANRRARKAGTETLLEDPEVPHSESPEAMLAARQTLDRVARSLAELDDDKRQVFVGHDIEGFGIPELSESLGIPMNTAYSRLRLARAAFEKSFRSEVRP
jgi:RNA polymerase sigma-70 factor (ECF subfamily)